MSCVYLHFSSSSSWLCWPGTPDKTKKASCRTAGYFREIIEYPLDRWGHTLQGKTTAWNRQASVALHDYGSRVSSCSSCDAPLALSNRRGGHNHTAVRYLLFLFLFPRPLLNELLPAATGYKQYKQPFGGESASPLFFAAQRVATSLTKERGAPCIQNRN